MRAIGIDSFLEALEESRTPGGLMGVATEQAFDWGRIVADGKAARAAADGGIWRIGQLALLVERKYRSGSLQRFAKDIGESYATVRRYRWVVSHYDTSIRFRFPGLSFSHFQAVASLPDRVSWLNKAEKGLWSVDRLIKESRGAEAAPTSAEITRLRQQMSGAKRTLSRVRSLDDATIATAKDWLVDVIDEIGDEIETLKRRIDGIARRRPVKRRHAPSVNRRIKSVH